MTTFSISTKRKAINTLPHNGIIITFDWANKPGLEQVKEVRQIFNTNYIKLLSEEFTHREWRRANYRLMLGTEELWHVRLSSRQT